MMLALDITRCSGLRCGRERDCQRWTQHLVDAANACKIDIKGKPISVAQFADHDGKCEEFWPFPEAKDEGAESEVSPAV